MSDTIVNFPNTTDKFSDKPEPGIYRVTHSGENTPKPVPRIEGSDLYYKICKSSTTGKDN